MLTLQWLLRGRNKLFIAKQPLSGKTELLVGLRAGEASRASPAGGQRAAWLDKVLLDKCCSGSLNGCREDTCPEEGFAHARFNPLRFAFVFVCFHGSRTQPSLTH